jgi:archaeal flagellar protein FlaI
MATPQSLKDLIDKTKKATAKHTEDKKAAAEKLEAKPEDSPIPAEQLPAEDIPTPDPEETKAVLKDLISKAKDVSGKKYEDKPFISSEERVAEIEVGAVEKKSSFQKEMDVTKKTLIESYGNAEIFKIPGTQLLHYVVPVPRPTASEKSVINVIKEAATRLISISPYKIRDPEQRRNVYFNQIIDILRASPELNIPERRFEFYANAVVREMVGYGLIDDLIRDDLLEEIMVIGASKPVYVFHRKHEMMTTNIEFFNDDEVQDLINRIARQIGRRVDISAPLLDARLLDGSRVNATIPPASVSGSSLTIRKFRADPFSIIDLVTFNTIQLEAAAFLWLAVDGLGVKPANIIVSGGTGSGKTTTLNVLSSLIPKNQRVLSIEDTAELSLPLEHWVRMEARPPGLEGKGELTMDILTKNSLRMRPDRIIVGEVRHKEASTLFTAMNTGHQGSMGTIHANTPDETVVRITSPPMNVPALMLESLDLILIEHRLHDARKGTIRRITEIAEVTGALDHDIKTKLLFERDPLKDTLLRTKHDSEFLQDVMKMTGLSQKDIEKELRAREKVLKDIQAKGIRDITQVKKLLEAYIIEHD